MSALFYTGAAVSDRFTKRWMSQIHIGQARPWMQVRIRRGRLKRTWHDHWPAPQFGRVHGQSIHHQWYPDWTPESDWVVLDSVHSVQLTQSFDQNGITSLTLQCDNVRFQPHTGAHGNLYHSRERGYLYPWKGYKPPKSPGGSGADRNEWWRKLPNAQIEIQQGYGADTAVKTFTGLIDNISFTGTPNTATITARDFGSVLTDSNIFGWNKTRNIMDPIIFVPIGYKPKGGAGNTVKRWIYVKDYTEIVECCLRWAGFKDWQVQPSGVNLKDTYTVDKSKYLIDVITDVANALGYVFFIAEPNPDNDLSIGTPIFRPSQATKLSSPATTNMIALHGHRMLTGFSPVHDNSQDRYIIRTRGQTVSRKKGGHTLYGDTTSRYTWQYWPPWMNWMAGVIKQLTYYNIGDAQIAGFNSTQQCMVSCILIAMQIALARDTATGTTLGHPGIGLDSFVYVTDESTGVAAKLYVTNRTSTMQIGGDGSSSLGASSNSAADPIWSTDFGGSLVDNPEWEHLRRDYDDAIHGRPVATWGTPN